MVGNFSQKETIAGSIPAAKQLFRSYYHAAFVYRFRTLAFHVSKMGSIPIRSTTITLVRV